MKKEINIDIDGPLPSHTKIDIWEAYAREILKYIDFSVFGTLEFSDKPDLQNKCNSVSCEVTQAISQEAQKAESLYSKLSREKDDAEKKKWIEQIASTGAYYSNGILFGPNGKNSFDLILESFVKKLNKLNSGNYGLCPYQSLFIISDTCADEEALISTLGQMVEEQNERINKFNKVFINAPGHVYIFDLVKNEYETLPLDCGTQFFLAEQARKVVLDEEQRNNHL